MDNSYPEAENKEMVGTYPASTKSGGGYFYDTVLEYRVWIHPEAGGEDLHNGNDYFYAFPSYEEALKFSNSTNGSEEPLVLVLQKEYINEPSTGVYEHIKEERITEWDPKWLLNKNKRRTVDSIEDFIKNHSK